MLCEQFISTHPSSKVFPCFLRGQNSGCCEEESESRELHAWSIFGPDYSCVCALGHVLRVCDRHWTKVNLWRDITERHCSNLTNFCDYSIWLSSKFTYWLRGQLWLQLCFHTEPLLRQGKNDFPYYVPFNFLIKQHDCDSPRVDYAQEPAATRIYCIPKFAFGFCWWIKPQDRHLTFSRTQIW